MNDGVGVQTQAAWLHTEWEEKRQIGLRGRDKLLATVGGKGGRNEARSFRELKAAGGGEGGLHCSLETRGRGFLVWSTCMIPVTKPVLASVSLFCERQYDNSWALP